MADWPSNDIDATSSWARDMKVTETSYPGKSVRDGEVHRDAGTAVSIDIPSGWRPCSSGERQAMNHRLACSRRAMKNHTVRMPSMLLQVGLRFRATGSPEKIASPSDEHHHPRGQTVDHRHRMRHEDHRTAPEHIADRLVALRPEALVTNGDDLVENEHVRL